MPAAFLRQPRLKKGKTRTPIASALQEEIRRAVEREARKFNCSKSFVVAVAVAHALDIDVVSYTELREVRK
jgi:hypothetical protein